MSSPTTVRPQVVDTRAATWADVRTPSRNERLNHSKADSSTH